MREVVITDIQYRMTMTAIWSLGRKGIPITAVGFDHIKPKAQLGFFSKYAMHQRIIPSPESSETRFLKELLGIGKEIVLRTGEKPILIIPRAQTHEIVIQNREDVAKYFEFNLVGQETLERANNTFLLAEVAEATGVDFPTTTWLGDDEAIEALSERITYPVVIKFRYSERLTLKPEQRYAIARTPDAFVTIYTNMHAIQASPLVQRYIEGDGFGVSVVFDDAHEPVEIFCHKRLREYPISGGPSTYCESIWDDHMVANAVKLLKKLSWKGFAMVEFKGHLDGELCLMEINPRFWGSMMLSLQAQCDMPFAYYKSVMHLSTAHGGSVRFDNRYKIGVRMQFILQDLLSVVQQIKQNPLKFSLMLSYIFTLLSPFTKDGIWCFEDPGPGFAYFKNALLNRHTS